MVKHPWHLTSMKNEFGDCTSRLSLCFRFSNSEGGCNKSISLESTCAHHKNNRGHKSLLTDWIQNNLPHKQMTQDSRNDVFERNTWEKPHYIARFSSRHPFRKTSADNSKKLMLKESILENTERRCKIMENVRLETTSGGIERLTMMTTTVHLVRSLQTRREPACKVTRFCEER
jgi:hypothetical protein